MTRGSQADATCRFSAKYLQSTRQLRILWLSALAVLLCIPVNSGSPGATYPKFGSTSDPSDLDQLPRVLQDASNISGNKTSAPGASGSVEATQNVLRVAVPRASKAQHRGLAPESAPLTETARGERKEVQELEGPGRNLALEWQSQTRRAQELPEDLKAILMESLGPACQGKSLTCRNTTSDWNSPGEDFLSRRRLIEQNWVGPQYPEVPLSVFWKSRKRKPAGKWPKVFMYTLPPVFKNDSRFGWGPIYGMEEAVSVVLRHMGYVVEDPEEADLFYVDAWFYNAMFPILDAYGRECTGHDHHDPYSCILIHALNIIRGAYPYFDRSKGVDHIWPMTYDHGFCGFWGAGDMNLPELAGGIIASHWGLASPEFRCYNFSRFQDSRCYDTMHREGSRQPRLACYVYGKDVLAAAPIFEQSRPHGGNRDTTFHGEAPILPPEKDPSWPPDTGQRLYCPFPYVLKDGLPTPHMYPNRPRNITLIFAGGLVMEDPRFSHGMRQSMYVMYNQSSQHRGFMVLPYVEDGFSWQARSRFCLTVTGAGWGTRFKSAILCGCIPVVISDDVARRYAYKLPDVLDFLEQHNSSLLDTMQRRIACAWRYFDWTIPFGRAGEAFLCSLRRKLMGHQHLIPKMDWDSCTLHCGETVEPAARSDAP